MASSMPTLTTTSYVLDEVVTFFNVREHQPRPSRWGRCHYEARRSGWPTSGRTC